MKAALNLLLCVLSTASCFSQTGFIQVIHLDSLPPQGVLLDRGWKFHAGDDTAWARADYDDSKWQNADLAHYDSYFPAFREKGIGWFRLKLFVDSPRNNQAVIELSQSGASQWYINGRLFIEFGRISSGKATADYNPHAKPVLFPNNIYDTILIAIRFASKIPAHPWLFSSAAAPPISIRANSLMYAISNYKAALLQPRMHIGYSFMSVGIGLIFILLFSFFPKEKSNLLFGAFCFFIALIPVIESQLAEASLNISSYAWHLFAMGLVNKICAVFILLIVSLEITGRVTIYQWAVIGWLLLLDSMLFLFLGDAGPVSVAGHIARALFAFEFLRLGALAITRWNFIIAIVAFSTGFLNVSLILAHYTSIHFTGFYTFFNGFLTLVMFSIYLISRFARTSKYQAFQLTQRTGSPPPPAANQ